MTAEDIKVNLTGLKASLPEHVTLVAVSKFHPVETLMAAYEAGQRVFGESRAQELVQKVSAMPEDVEWHFIGHLQTNKVRAIVPYVRLIHSVDSEKLLETIDAEARRIDRVVDVLLQLHVAQEATKFGLAGDECRQLVESGLLGNLSHIRVCGVMGMATNTDDENEIRKEFHKIRMEFDRLKDGVMATCPYFNIISMGMSDDYPLAVEEGATMVRIGSKIFGPRQY